MRMGIELRIILFAVLATAVYVAPGTVGAIVFVVVLWALWRRSPQRRGGRR
ncbi:hypothetical protein ACWDYH_02610 [Nocardia goodfellowii]